MSDEDDVIEQQLEELDEKSEECFQTCQIRTAIRIAKEATRLAKSNSNVIHYMRGLFDQMRFGHGMLDPQATREVSVELVLLLEDEEQARRIQPNLDEGHYHWLCSWMSTCAYDNLAEATGTMSGCNSHGMHECINDGLQICRQTGKMECIKCFREYAADVYMAADDFDMVRHQCQTFLEYHPGGNDNKDRRWSGHQKLAKLQLLEGRVDSAIEDLKQAYELAGAEDVYLKLRSKAIVALTLDEALILAGQPRFDWTELNEKLPESGEWPFFEVHREMVEALALTVAEDYDAAIEKLTQLDRQMTELNCRKEWFEVRLRLIAAYLLKGDRPRAERLAKGLEASADEAQDFLTMRRLKHLLSTSGEVSPIAAIQETASITSANSVNGEESSAENVEADEESTPLEDQLNQYMQRIMEVSGDDEARIELLNEFLANSPEQIESSKDAAYLVHFSQFLVRGTEDALKVWPWAEDMLKKFSDDPIVVSVVATLGYYFKSADGPNFEFISLDQLEKWFRQSTTPQVEHAKNFARAGSFFMDEGDYGEAERNYSRAFRLNRVDPSIVIPLADLYRQSDRVRDGLAVLDLSLREGCDDQTVAWEAAMTALQLDQFDAVQTYLDKYLELGKPDAWAHYFKALAAYHLDQFEESIKHLDLELEFDLPGHFHIQLLRTCNLIALGDNEAAQASFDDVLATQLREVDYLSLSQLVRNLGILWNSARSTEEFAARTKKLEDIMLRAGLLPDEYFETQRESTEIEEEIYHFAVQTHQPLDETWPESQGCLTGQEEWDSYEAEWGVLAKDEEQAINLVLEYQSRCFPLPVEIVNLQTDEQEYRDRPGVVWQGVHWSQSDVEDIDDEEFSDLGEEE